MESKPNGSAAPSVPRRCDEDVVLAFLHRLPSAWRRPWGWVLLVDICALVASVVGVVLLNGAADDRAITMSWWVAVALDAGGGLGGLLVARRPAGRLVGILFLTAALLGAGFMFMLSNLTFNAPQGCTQITCLG